MTILVRSSEKNRVKVNKALEKILTNYLNIDPILKGIYKDKDGKFAIIENLDNFENEIGKMEEGEKVPLCDKLREKIFFEARSVVETKEKFALISSTNLNDQLDGESKYQVSEEIIRTYEWHGEVIDKIKTDIYTRGRTK